MPPKHHSRRLIIESCIATDGLMMAMLKDPDTRKCVVSSRPAPGAKSSSNFDYNKM
jgi:hypothetical protein